MAAMRQTMETSMAHNHTRHQNTQGHSGARGHSGVRWNFGARGHFGASKLALPQHPVIQCRNGQTSRSLRHVAATGAARAAIVPGPLDSPAPPKPNTERAKMEAKRRDQIELGELEKPLSEYMSLPASQYSVLDAERIERVDDSTFKCYAHRLNFMMLEVCPVLLVRVEEKADGCCIRLLGCQLDGSPIVKESNDKFSASMENNVSWSINPSNPESSRLLVSNTTITVTVDIPTPFKIIPKDYIESAGSQVLSQLLRVALPRFLTQLKKDYKAWASGDTSRKPLGTGEI